MNMDKLFMSFGRKSTSSPTVDLKRRTSPPEKQTSYEIFVLSDSQLEHIFSYLSYHELMHIRSVCRWFYYVVGTVMNRKFQSVSKEVEYELAVEKHKKSISEGRVKALYILASEFRIMESHCMEYIEASMFYFYGGMILDYVDYIVYSRNDDVMNDISEMFMMVDNFMNSFDTVSEPVLLGRSYHLPFSWFGRKLVDLLECYACMEHFVAVEPLVDGTHLKWTGKYMASPVHSLLPPPFLVNSTEGMKTDMDLILKYIRNHIRWNNILDVIKNSSDALKRYENRITVEDNDSQRDESWQQRIIYEKVRTDDSFAGASDLRKLEVNIGLYAHEIFSPARYKALVETNSNLGQTPDDVESKSEDELVTEPNVPKEHDYEMDLTIEITYMEGDLGQRAMKTRTFQICHIDNACYIATNTSVLP